jgi:hypothetical protein
VEPLGFIDGRRAFVRLANLLGPALSRLETPKPGPDGKVSEESAAAVFGSALGAILTTLKDEDLTYFENLFAARTFVKLPDGREPLLRDAIKAEHFAGSRLADYFGWLVFSLQVTYGDFFGDAWRKLGASRSQAVKANPSS